MNVQDVRCAAIVMETPKRQVARGLIVLLMAAAVTASAALAQDDAAPTAQELARQKTDAERAHLWRVAAWGGASAAAGLALVTSYRRSDVPARWAFGLQTGLWGVVNVGIAAAGLSQSGAPAATYAEALAAERNLHDLLLLNMGLNVAYVGVGTAMTIASYYGVSGARRWRGHGLAVVVQGAALLALDGLALLASRSRLADLVSGVTGNAAAFAFPTGLAVTVPL